MREVHLTGFHMEYGEWVNLLGIRNEPSVRSACGDPKEITLEEHEAWFRGRLGRSWTNGQFVYVRPDDGPLQLAGAVVFHKTVVTHMDQEEYDFEVSYYITEKFRNQSVGSEAVARALLALRQQVSTVSPWQVSAWVRFGNKASESLLKGLNFKFGGFQERESNLGKVFYHHWY